MKDSSGMFIVGGGAIGFSLAAHLASSGKVAEVLRINHSAVGTTEKIAVKSGDGHVLEQSLTSKPLSSVRSINGVVIVTAKANANEYLADVLSKNVSDIDLVLLQNGIGVERPFMSKGFRSVSRCVVYITAEKVQESSYTARMVKPSPIGLLEGTGEKTADIAGIINTEALRFYNEPDIEYEIWKKGIINTVFNSICPLLDTDNGIFERDETIMALAKSVVKECVPVANRVGIEITTKEIIEGILAISQMSAGQLISTLQDIRAHRETEMNYFNMEICRIAEAMKMQTDLSLTRMLGALTIKKAELARDKEID